MRPIEVKKEDIEGFKNLLDFFRRISEDGVDQLIEKPVITLLDFTIPFLSTLVMKSVFPEIHRLTINRNVVGQNSRIRDIKFLKYPPAEKVTKYGRCNFPGQSIFYGSFMLLTPLIELKPHIGDLITHSIWKVKNEQELNFCPIFLNQPKGENIINERTLEITWEYKKQLEQYPQNIQEQINELVKFITDAFTKEVNPNNHLDYIFSAYFSNKIFNEFENGTVEAIYYPSVKEKLSFENIAIKPETFDNKYELFEVNDLIVINRPSNDFGGFIMDGLGECKSFDYSAGKIMWDSKQISQSKEKVLHYQTIFGLKLE